MNRHQPNPAESAGRCGPRTATRRRLVVSVALLSVAAGSGDARSGPAADAVTAGAPGRLNTALAPGRSVGPHEISPDSNWVVYIADQNTDDVNELFTVPVGGGTPARLNADLPRGGDVFNFAISADSLRVIYQADQNTDNVNELFSVPMGGGTPVRLNSNIPTNGAVDTFAVSPDSARVVYRADQITYRVKELFSVPVGGGSPTRLNTPLPEGGNVSSYTIAPDSARVTYRADQNTDEVFELFSIPTVGGNPTRLNTQLPKGGGVEEFAVTPDSARVIYIADQNDYKVYELFSVPTAGGGNPTRLNTPLPKGGGVVEFAVSPDSARVIYIADQNEYEVYELFSVPTAGGGKPTRLNTPLPKGGGVGEFAVSPDSARVIYGADQNTHEVYELFSVPTAGGTPVRLNTDLPADTGVSRFAVSADSSRVVYAVALPKTGILELFSVPAAGGIPVRLDTERPAGSGGEGFVMSPDSARVIYGAAPADSEAVEVFSVPIAGGPRVRLNSDLVAGGSVSSAFVSPDAQWVVYAADQVIDEVRELFAVAMLPDGASVFTPLSPTRVFDTRAEQSAPGPKGLVGPDAMIDVQVGGLAGVPATATAVVLNVTATDARAAGFVTVWPAGRPRPLASSLNLTAADQTRPNMVIVPLGAGGRVSLYSQSGAHLLADVTGFFAAATGPVTAGRILPLDPARVFDTRISEPAAGPKGLVAAGATVTAQIAGVAGIPADATAAVLNITATDAAAAGFVTVWPTGQHRPVASTLNLARAGDTTPNLVIMPLGAGGRIDLFSQSGAHLLADVTGYVTAHTAPSDIAGLFVPLDPTRVFDTRNDQTGAVPRGQLAPGATVTARITGQAGLPATVGLAALNLTATEAGTGFVTAYPGPARPLASTLNLSGPDDTRPNATLTPVNPAGQLRLFSLPATHLLADTAGYTLP